jgi:hypothetical protein
LPRRLQVNPEGGVGQQEGEKDEKKKIARDCRKGVV